MTETLKLSRRKYITPPVHAITQQRIAQKLQAEEQGYTHLFTISMSLTTSATAVLPVTLSMMEL